MSYAPVGHGYNACTSVFQLIMDLIFKLTSAAIDKMIRAGMVVIACGEPQALLPVQFWSLARTHIQKPDVGTISKTWFSLATSAMYVGACLWNAVCLMTQGSLHMIRGNFKLWTCFICVSFPCEPCLKPGSEAGNKVWNEVIIIW